MRKYLLVVAIILLTSQAHAVTRGLTLATGPGAEASVPERVPELPKVAPPELPKQPGRAGTDQTRAPEQSRALSPSQPAPIAQPQVTQPSIANVTVLPAPGAQPSAAQPATTAAVTPAGAQPAVAKPVTSQPIAVAPPKPVVANAEPVRRVVERSSKRATTEVRIRRELRSYVFCRELRRYGIW